MTCKFQPLRYTENISVFYRTRCIYNPILFKGKKNHNSISRTYNYNIYNDTIKENVNTSDIHYPKNIIYQPSINRTKLLHPTQKPVALIEYLIKTYTNEGEIVLDFAAGSGTTGVAAMETNRKCVLIEKEEKYCEITIKRLQEKEKEIAERLF